MATIKQKRLAKNIGKSRSITEAMIKSGYSPTSAHQQTTITAGKGWKELMEKYLPDDKLLQVHDEGLSATKVVTSPTEPDQEVPDYSTRAKYLELGYKIKGKMSENSVQIANVSGEMGINFISGDKE